MQWHWITTAELALTIAMVFSSAAGVASAKEGVPPQRHLRKYELHGDPSAADISPDERMVATQVTRSEPENDPTRIRTVELAQLWDFRQDHLVAEVELEEVVSDKWRVPRDSLPRFARFTADGQLVVIYLHLRLHVFSATDLHELRCIEMSEPPDVIGSYPTKSGRKSYEYTPRLSLLEISPVAHRAAAVWATGEFSFFAQVDVLDLDSGRLLGEWIPRDRGMGVCRPIAVTWGSRGRELVLAVPNDFPCSSPDNHADVFVVDAMSAAIQTKWKSGIRIGAVAVTPDDRLWAVDSEEIGVFKSRSPEMRVFDLRTGKLLREISGRGSGVRFAVSASRNGDRIAAYTGKMKVDFDWSDMVGYSVPVDRTFSVWNSNNFEGLVTSQDLGGPRTAWVGANLSLSFHLSAGGKFLLVGASIYELP